jgi:hypothetical protein
MSQELQTALTIFVYFIMCGSVVILVLYCVGIAIINKERKKLADNMKAQRESRF